MDKRTLTKYFGTRFTPKQLNLTLALINGNKDPLDFKSVDTKIRRYSDPIRQILTAVDEVLEGYGVEDLQGGFFDKHYQDIQALYVNFGETYTTTIIYDLMKEKFLVSSSGVFVESNPERFPRD
jgi:hypothetical protein